MNSPEVDPDMIEFSAPCLRARQPIGDVFCTVFDHKELSKITYFDVRRVLQDARDVERYLGIQRPLKTKKVQALKDYVRYFDASFPTSVIIYVPAEYVTYNDQAREMRFRNFQEHETAPSIAISNLAKVLDGQHRIAGLAGFEGTFDLAVTVFVGADLADQAQIFATVNLEQDKVSKNLVYDLTELAEKRSPQKTCHHVAVALDKDPTSPLAQRIKRLGVPTVGRSFEPISQATFVESLLPYITKNANQDRDTILRGNTIDKVHPDEWLSMPFRNLFVEGHDLKIARIIYDYFTVVENVWPAAWNSEDRGDMLNRTNGFRALMRAYRSILEEYNGNGKFPSKDYLSRYLRATGLRGADFTTDTFPPGSSGEGKLFRVLSGAVSIEDIRRARA